MGRGWAGAGAKRPLRAFLAFEVSPEVRESLMRVEDEIRQTRADVKPVEKDNLHFTVKFLGDVPDSVVAEIDRRMGALALERIEVMVKGLGAFPDAKRPRVVWAGASPETAPRLAETGKRILEAIRGLGQEDSRGFSPHITVARVRSPRNQEALTALIRGCSGREFGATTITSLKLKSSTLSPRGPTYADVREYALS